MRSKDMVNWSSPKYYQSGWEKFHQHFGKRKDPKYCKKLKGPHNYVLIEHKDKSFWRFDWEIFTYKCSGCTKQLYRSKPLKEMRV